MTSSFVPPRKARADIGVEAACSMLDLSASSASRLVPKCKVTYRGRTRKVRVRELGESLETVRRWVRVNLGPPHGFELEYTIGGGNRVVLDTDESVSELLDSGSGCLFVQRPNRRAARDMGEGSDEVEVPLYGPDELPDEVARSQRVCSPGITTVATLSVVFSMWILAVIAGIGARPSTLGANASSPNGADNRVLPGGLRLEDVRALRAQVAAAQARMCGMWPDNDGCALVQTGWVGGADGGEAIVHKILRAMLQIGPVDGETGGSVGDDRFTISVTGSSTSAGHDTHINYTYSALAQRYLAPLFSRAGVNLTVRNQAMGGWDYRSGTMYCLNNIAGPDADVVFWEWGCFGPTSCSEEVFARAAFSMRRRPAVVFFESFGGGKPGAMYHSEVYYALARDRGLLDAYMGNAACFPQRREVGPPENFLNPAWFAEFQKEWKGCEDARRQGEPWYSAHANQLYAHVGQGAVDEKYKRGEYQDASLFPQRHATYYSKAGFQAYRMNAATTHGVDHKPWWIYRMNLFRVVHHAGVLGHLMSGHMVSHAFLGFLDGALARVEAAMQSDGLAGLRKDVAESQAARLRAPLPEPRECAVPGIEIPSHGSHCYTTFRPREGPGIDTLVRGGGGSLGKWHADFAEDGQKTSWYLNEAEGDYRDLKSDISGVRADGWVRMQLPARRKQGGVPSRLIVCQGRRDLNRLNEADVEVDGVLWYKGKGSDLSRIPKFDKPIDYVRKDFAVTGEKYNTNCGYLGDLPEGPHLLSIRAGVHKLQLSHVILV